MSKNKNEEKKNMGFDNTLQAVKLFVKEALKEIDAENNNINFIAQEFSSNNHRIINIHNINNEYQIVHYENIKKKEPTELYAAYIDLRCIEKNIKTFDLAIIKAIAYKYKASGAAVWISRMLEMEQSSRITEEAEKINPSYVDSVGFNPFTMDPEEDK